MRPLILALVVCGVCLNNTVAGQSPHQTTPEWLASFHAEPALTPEDSAVERQASPAPPNPFAGDFLDRQYMSGDWCGWRSPLAERGVTMDIFATQFYQGVTAGGQAQEWEYGGKLDFLPNFDGQKLGLWQGSSANMHVETRYGTDTNVIDGTLMQTNAAMAFPVTDESTGVWITALRFNQALSEHLLVFAGSINGLDGYALKYSPGVATNLPGLGGFQNIGLTFNPIAARGVPYSAAAAGAVIPFGQGSTFALSVIDPEERSDRGMGDLFATGVTLATDLVLRADPVGLPMILDLGGVYTTADYMSVDPTVYMNLLRLGQLQAAIGAGALPVESESWAFYASGSQALWQNETDEKATWGVFGGVGVSDGNPNPIKYYASCGIGGRNMLASRPLDSHGLGFFYIVLSDEIKTLTQSVLPLRDEYGAELFYNAAVTRWCRLTPNFQVVRPGVARVDTAILAGIRLELIL